MPSYLIEKLKIKKSEFGDIVYSQRLTLKINCFMDLRLFPFDGHLCPLSFYSYAHRDYQIKMEWNSATPVTFPNLELPEYDLGNIYIRKDCVRAWRTGNFSCLDAYFVVNRNFGFYGLYFYFPSIICVVTSWIGLWVKIEPEISEARVTLPIAEYLTLATVASGNIPTCCVGWSAKSIIR